MTSATAGIEVCDMGRLTWVDKLVQMGYDEAESMHSAGRCWHARLQQVIISNQFSISAKNVPQLGPTWRALRNNRTWWHVVWATAAKPRL